VIAPAQQRKPKRLFTGLVGLPPGPVAVAEPAQIPSIESYDPKTYEPEIRKALGYSSIRWLRRTTEGQKDLQDLEQTIHIELGVAISRYNEKMNPALAYQIARNHIARFIDAKAKQPESLSLDDTPEDKDPDESEISEAEELLFNRGAEGVRSWDFNSGGDLLKMGNPGSWEQALQERGGVLALRDLICTWTGIKRLVADVMLVKPDMTVDDLPGIPRSTVQRWRKIVLTAFKNYIQQQIKPITKSEQMRTLARRFLRFIGGRGLSIYDLEVLPVAEQQIIKDSFLAENKPVIN
jgi:hypothetical protein